MAAWIARTRSLKVLPRNGPAALGIVAAGAPFSDDIHGGSGIRTDLWLLGVAGLNVVSNESERNGRSSKVLVLAAFYLLHTSPPHFPATKTGGATEVAAPKKAARPP